MRKNDLTEAIIDNVLRFGITSTALAAGIMIPNLLVALDKPLDKFWKHMDKRQREREVRRIISYMKTQRLIAGNYQHGMQITKKGAARLVKKDVEAIQVKNASAWDRRWRLVIYDIPEEYKYGRQRLTGKLNQLGFYQLQRSAWLHPFPCRDVVELISAYHQVNKFVSFLETDFIDNQTVLIKRFKEKYPETKF